jgi:DNA-binding NtrC family response regulator
MSPIIVPPLTSRATELAQIIDAYAMDAGAIAERALSSADRIWIRDHESKTLGKIQEVTRRLAAIRSAHGNLTSAAEQLGMSLSALYEWSARRTF